ncbi:fumarylacetoacetate hydrolase family protein [Cohnella rhizosphaerae]|uniref:Fumarylacetoacetate hydrolase family protein n=1 Tax=Cohnella rhizosphaerae TaxID=1457232 RepID=A0A9X4QV38_9BACL|nr:fumarylacetoacetate hydrolase family protein [Cohnella rhizosphaerae]MDG0812023.1 fumarylacetoacetate hydrolase family protein [Cohnella rhizosphaerae]
MTKPQAVDCRNLFCVGRNYRLHAAELGNAVPASPMIFAKPSHAVVRLDGADVQLPRGRGAVHYEAELVFFASRTYEPGIAPHELYTHFTVGLDLTLRDVQDELKAKGYPWLAAKGFRHSAPLGDWLPYGADAEKRGRTFAMRLNGKEVQRGDANDMVFDLAALTAHVGDLYGIGPGDLLFTGTPAGVGSLSDGDAIELLWGDDAVGTGTFRFR